MKIITYNIWNSDSNYKSRLELLCNVLKYNGADVIALQEVRDKETVDLISMQCDYKYFTWGKYPFYILEYLLVFQLYHDNIYCLWIYIIFVENVTFYRMVSEFLQNKYFYY